MKRNLLLVILLAICSNLTFGIPTDTRKRIKMKVRQPTEHRSTLPSPVQAYTNNSVLEIEFNIAINDYTIWITNLQTGEVVYSEKGTSPERVIFIDLYEKDKTAEYSLEISSPRWTGTGVFTIE